jgi:hypothetical protein
METDDVISDTVSAASDRSFAAGAAQMPFSHFLLAHSADREMGISVERSVRLP